MEPKGELGSHLKYKLSERLRKVDVEFENILKLFTFREKYSCVLTLDLRKKNRGFEDFCWISYNPPIVKFSKEQIFLI